MDLEQMAREMMRLYNDGETEALRDGLAEDVIYEDPLTGGPVRGADAMVETVFGRKVPFPDLHIEIDRVATDGGLVVIEGRWLSHHGGPLPLPDGNVIVGTGEEMPPVPVCAVVEVRDGRVVAMRQYWDPIPSMTAIGALAWTSAGPAKV